MAAPNLRIGSRTVVLKDQLNMIFSFTNIGEFLKENKCVFISVIDISSILFHFVGKVRRGFSSSKERYRVIGHVYTITLLLTLLRQT